MSHACLAPRTAQLSEIIHLLSDRKSNVNRVLSNVTGKTNKTKGSPRQKSGYAICHMVRFVCVINDLLRCLREAADARELKCLRLSRSYSHVVSSRVKSHRLVPRRVVRADVDALWRQILA